MGFLLTYLHSTLTYSKGQSQSFARFGCKHLVNGDRCGNLTIAVNTASNIFYRTILFSVVYVRPHFECLDSHGPSPWSCSCYSSRFTCPSHVHAIALLHKAGMERRNLSLYVIYRWIIGNKDFSFDHRFSRVARSPATAYRALRHLPLPQLSAGESKTTEGLDNLQGNNRLEQSKERGSLACVYWMLARAGGWTDAGRTPDSGRTQDGRPRGWSYDESLPFELPCRV